MIDFPASPSLNQVFVAPNNVTYVWDGSSWNAVLNPIVIGVPNYVSGLYLSNDTVAPNTGLKVAAGEMRMNSLFMRLVSGVTLDLSKNWAAGGALDIGAFAASTTYHVHGIRKQSDGSPAFVASLSIPPVVPSGYDLLGRIGSIMTKAGPAVVSFRHNWNEFMTELTAFDATGTVGATWALQTLLNVPSGVSVEARVVMAVTTTVNGAGAQVHLHNYDEPSSPAWYPHGRLIFQSSGQGGMQVVGTAITNTSRQIGLVTALTSATGTWQINSHGWNDYQIPRTG